MKMLDELEAGEIPSIRGVIKCFNCGWYQSYISQIPSTKEKGYFVYGVTKQMRTSKCRKCLRKNRFTLTNQWYNHRGRKKPIGFMQCDKTTPRDALTLISNMNNKGDWDGILAPSDYKFKKGNEI